MAAISDGAFAAVYDRYYDRLRGFIQKEIAEVLAIDVGNVKVRLLRARKKMTTILETNCRFERDERNIFVCVSK